MTRMILAILMISVFECTAVGRDAFIAPKGKTLGNTAQFPPSGLSTASAAAAQHLRCQNAAAPRSPYRHLELCGIALTI